MKNDFKVEGDTVKILVTQKNGREHEVLIDKEDFDLVNEEVSTLGVRDNENTFYATYQDKNTKKKKVLHRLIMNPPEEMFVDHRNHNGLDNQKNNLRICTPSQNSKNKKTRKKNDQWGDKYRGVYWEMTTGKYRAQVMIDGVTHRLGIYDTPEEANEVVVAFRRKHMPFSTI